MVAILPASSLTARFHQYIYILLVLETAYEMYHMLVLEQMIHIQLCLEALQLPRLLQETLWNDLRKAHTHQQTSLKLP